MVEAPQLGGGEVSGRTAHALELYLRATPSAAVTGGLGCHGDASGGSAGAVGLTGPAAVRCGKGDERFSRNKGQGEVRTPVLPD